MNEKPKKGIVEKIIRNVMFLACFGIGIVLFLISFSDECSPTFSILFIVISGLYFIKAFELESIK